MAPSGRLPNGAAVVVALMKDGPYAVAPVIVKNGLLFHIWNPVLKEYELSRFGRSWDNIQYVLHHGNKIRFGTVHPARGFQDSIFDDEIKGAFKINFRRGPDEGEQEFLRRR